MVKQKILIADDEEDLVELVKDILKKEGYSVAVAYDSEETFEKVKTERPNLIILDVRFPKIGGVEVCKILKSDEQTRAIPIIMLSVQSQEMDKVIGLESGADDYLTKPVAKKELVARVRAALRKGDYGKKEKKILKYEDLIIDTDKHIVILSKKSINLRPKEFDLLCLFLQKRGKMLTRNFILESVWGYEYFGTTRTVDMTVGHLRKKLGPYSKNIETIPGGVGYRFKE
ncbi:MAG: response regulator transcription factor [Elusimicrobia bacterium]|nr:response regulator transcription factor [Elusimicrobiota bacterium]